MGSLGGGRQSAGFVLIRLGESPHPAKGFQVQGLSCRQQGAIASLRAVVPLTVLRWEAPSGAGITGGSSSWGQEAGKGKEEMMGKEQPGAKCLGNLQAGD